MGSVLLIAACLRPTITCVGPLISEIGAETGMTQDQLGFLGALPVLMFATVSPFVGHLGRARGPESAVTVALVCLALGTVIRSLGGSASLCVGTAVASAAIAVANVLSPTLVKRDFGRPALGVALFTTCLSGAAALASGTTAPLSQQFGGWREGLVVWAVLPALVLPVWVARSSRLRGKTAIEPLDPAALFQVVRSPISWQVAGFFGRSRCRSTR
ncbi:MFS transporter [Pedococcus sp. NPDC057267]|uniref:MFS transporter n=1 Tax=Pedococcus sp. NPDC057267 TaxID=3346077 RepID=UPI0036416D6D